MFDEGIKALTESYDKRFEEIFPIPASYTPSDRDSLVAFSKAITSNLIGGIGYFYGESIVDRSFAEEWDEDEESTLDFESSRTPNPQRTEPLELLTATPSRSFFPRGFYW